jgi:hypothetical protein
MVANEQMCVSSVVPLLPTPQPIAPMSVLPLKADVVQRISHVRFVPEADIPVLFDHLVGQLQKGFAH